MHPKTLRQAARWVERRPQWCEFCADFPEGTPYVDGGRVYTYERPGRTRSSLSRPAGAGTLSPAWTRPRPRRPLPRTNSLIEDGTGARLGNVLHNHSELSLMRRAKAVLWWCHLHTEAPRDARGILAPMPTDDDIDLPYRTYSASHKREDSGP